MARSSSSNSSSNRGRTAIHGDGCRSVLFTVCANTIKLSNPTFHLSMGEKNVSTDPISTPGNSRVFGSVVIPYSGEHKIHLEAVSQSGKRLGKHTFDLRKIPNIYSFYEGTVELSKRGNILSKLDIRIDFSKKKVAKIVDRKGIFGMCHSPTTANFERNVKRKGNCCNAVVSDGSSEDKGRRKIFLNKNSSSSSVSINAVRRPVVSTVAYGAVVAPAALSASSSLKKTTSSSSKKSSSSSSSSSSSTKSSRNQSPAKLAKVDSSKSSSSSSSKASGARIIAVPDLKGAPSSSSSSSSKQMPVGAATAGVVASIAIPLGKDSSSSSEKSTSRRRFRRRKESSPKAATSVTPKSRMSCSSMCGGKKDSDTVIPTPVTPNNQEADLSTPASSRSKRRRTGKKVTKSGSSPVTSSPLRRAGSSCSSVRSNMSGCSGKKVRSPVRMMSSSFSMKGKMSPTAAAVSVSPVVRSNPAPPPSSSSSSSSSNPAVASPAPVATTAAPVVPTRPASSSSSSSSGQNRARQAAIHANRSLSSEYVEPVESPARSSRRTKKRRANSVASSRPSHFSCASSKPSKFTCGSRKKNKNLVAARSQGLADDLSSVSGF